VPVIAQLVQADEDTVRDVIHRFNEIGLACLDPRWAGGRPRLLSNDEKDFVIQTATTRPANSASPSPAGPSASSPPTCGKSTTG
jgi:transposase